MTRAANANLNVNFSNRESFIKRAVETNDATRKVVLTVRDVYKSYRAPDAKMTNESLCVEVLRGVSFEVCAGEMVAITGASGAGKSTLLHVLGGLDAADAGSVRLGDIEITGLKRDELAQIRGREIGFVFQSHRLIADLTALENVALPLMIARRTIRDVHEQAKEMLAHVGLAHRAAHRVGELSGGEAQRTAIARALVTRPRLVLADEPTGNLDERTAADIGARLVELCRASHTAIVIATHNERLAESCDRVMVLRKTVLGLRS